MISYNLTGKTALVTGGGSGIGLEAARIMAQGGAKVAINYLPADTRGDAALAQFSKSGLDVIGAPGDVGNADDASRMVLKAIEDLGHLDLLINNAGTPGRNTPVPISDLDQITEQLWADILNVNTLWACSGALCGCAGSEGFEGCDRETRHPLQASAQSPALLLYSASKAAVINLTKNLAHALAPDVRVNAVAPGVVDSSWNMEWSQRAHTTPCSRTRP